MEGTEGSVFVFLFRGRVKRQLLELYSHEEGLHQPRLWVGGGFL